MTILTLNAKAFYAASKEIVSLVGDLTTAAFLQQIHAWTENERSGRIFDGTRWIHRSYKAWQHEDFPHLSISQIRRHIGKLKDLGVVKTEQWTKHHDDKNCYWYAVDYDALKQLLPHKERLKAASTTSDALSIGTVTFNEAPAENDTPPDNFGDLSIYIKKTIQKNLLEENNNTEVAAAKSTTPMEREILDPEEEGSTDITLPVATETLNNGVNDSLDREGLDARAGCDNNSFCDADFYYKMCLVTEDAEIKSNKKLEQQIDKYTYEEVELAVNCYNEWVEQGKVFTNPQGWLVDCLRGQYWENSPSRQERRRTESEITELMLYYGKKPEAGFFEVYWKAAEENLMLDFDESRYQGDRAGQLLVDKAGVWVCSLDDDLREVMVNFRDFAKEV